MTLSEYLISYRAEHNMSQRSFAKACGLSNGYISMIEKNENPKTGKPIEASMPALYQIARAMGMTLSDLLNAVDDLPVSLDAEVLNEIASVTENHDGRNLDAELASAILSLSAGNKEKALDYIRYLSASEDNKQG